MLVYSVHSSVLLPEVMLPPGRGGGPLNWEGAGVTRTDPTVDIVSTRQVIIPLPAARSLGGLSPPETKKARTASIRSDPCPAGAFARLHHTQIKIFPADHTITLVRCHTTTTSHHHCLHHHLLRLHPVQSFCGGNGVLKCQRLKKEPGAFL